MVESAPPLFAKRPRRSHRHGALPCLPISRAELDQLGWDCCDVVVVSGDAYVDHASFGAALIGRLLEAQGFRVGIISQPDWRSADAFRALGQPRLFFGVTAGNMDSMVNRYTADRRIRSDDAYTPGAAADRRPDRAALVYAQRCREAFRDTPVVLGGIEASLRRLAHYDYWSDQVRRSILVDAKADLLLYGNAERAVVELARRLDTGTPIGDVDDLRGSALLHRTPPAGWQIIDATVPGTSTAQPRASDRERTAIRLPGYEELREDRLRYAHASRLLHLESNPFNARALVQRHGDRDLWVLPPPLPLTTDEMDQVHGLPFSRRPHPSYGDARIPAYEMIRHSVAIMRGCFGGCAFCSLTEHEGRIVQCRSVDSVLREIEKIRDSVPGFTGIISDLGGPTANMYRMRCRDRSVEMSCRRLSCVYPTVCRQLDTAHAPLIQLYRQARAVDGVKKIVIGSGVRFDLASRSPEYVAELARHHVGGYLKIAPEHIAERPLRHMLKPPIASYERFKQLFDQASAAAGKEQYLIPYFIAGHPGTSDEDMLELALWLKRNDFRLDQVQTFLPTPMTLATAMYHSGLNPLTLVGDRSDDVVVAKGDRARKLHKAFLRYHDPANWPLLRRELERMGRSDLIGNGKRHLVPRWQPRAKR